MAISVGDTLPEADLFIMGKDGPGTVSTSSFFSNKNVVLFAVPGAFTPTCSNQHLPGFIEHAEAIKAKDIDEIAVVSCNDVFVMTAWAKTMGAENNINFLCDPSAAFATQIGMNLDLTDHGLGMRSKRYAMVVKNGTVTALNIDAAPSNADASSAVNILAEL